MKVNEKVKRETVSGRNKTRSAPGRERLSIKVRSTAQPEDHRVRVARERRAKMRARLLHSVYEVCSGEKDREPAVIDDVVRHARVSRGTFYTYFDSMEIAIADLGLDLADEMTSAILAIYDVLEDPVMRTATGFQLFLLRSVIDAQWAAFIARIGLLSGDNHLLTSKIKSDIKLGIETGDYVVASVDFATDLLMGAKIEAIRRIIAGESTSQYIQIMASMVLRSFGVAPTKADKTVQKAYVRIGALAPSKIAWWRPID
jgi:AcrR family transcriptional regulator